MNTQLTPRAVPAAAHLQSLRTELDTDWAPDPWGYLDIDPSQAERLLAGSALTAMSFLTVPFLGGRARRIALLDVPARLRMQRTAVSVVAAAQHRLARGVFPYRVHTDGTIAHYREAAAERRRYEDTVASQNRFVAQTDVKRFFPAVSYELLLDVSLSVGAPLQPLDSEFLNAIALANGYPLLEGYVAARALANVVLMPVDDVIERPFTRWIDDYRIFAESFEVANEQLTLAMKAITSLGLGVADQKSVIHSVGQWLGSQPPTSLEAHGDVKIRDVDLDTRPKDLERYFRLQFRIASDTRNNAILRQAWDMRASLPATVLPRLCSALASTLWSQASANLFDHCWHIDDEFTMWRRVRLAYALWYAPREFCQERSEIWADVLDGDSPILPALGRSLAHHLPRSVVIDDLCKSMADARAARLIRAEADRRRDDVVTSPPPVHSFL